MATTVTITKGPHEVLKRTLYDHIVAQGERWRKVTRSGVRHVMFAFREMGLITTAEWRVWDWLVEAVEAAVAERPLKTPCPGCGGRKFAFACGECKRLLVYHPCSAVQEVSRGGFTLRRRKETEKVLCEGCALKEGAVAVAR